MNITINLMLIAGFGLITIGFYLIAPLVAFIGGGLLVLVFAGLLAVMESKNDEKKPIK